MPKKFETQGYSAIGNVFKRDAAIAAEPPIVAPQSTEEAAPDTATEETESVVTPQPRATEAVVELKPKAAPQAPPKASPKTPSPAKATTSRAAKKTTPGTQSRSTRDGGRLPAIRVECMADEFQDFQAMVFALGRAAGHKLSNNIVGRALVRIALEQEDEIRKVVANNPPRPRPANGNAEELARHEDEWQQAIREALRSIPNRRSR